MVTENLAERLAGLQRAMATPLPGADELAAGKTADKAMAERIRKARPGIPLHHAYAVLETLRTIQAVEAAKAAPALGYDPNWRCPDCNGGLLPLSERYMHEAWHAEQERDRYRAAWLSASRRAAGLESDMRHYEETVIGDLNERNIRDCRRAARAEAQVARIRAFLEDMAGWSFPRDVYARRGLEILDGDDELTGESIAVQDVNGLVPARVGKTEQMRRIVAEQVAAGMHVHVVSQGGIECPGGQCVAAPATQASEPRDG
jgi:hypothetical protein